MLMCTESSINYKITFILAPWGQLVPIYLQICPPLAAEDDDRRRRTMMINFIVGVLGDSIFNASEADKLSDRVANVKNQHPNFKQLIPYA